MTTTTARHSFITWPEGTTQPQVGYNDLVDKLDVEVGLSVISRTTDAQPATPTEGDTYIITGSATGAAWSTYSQHDIAIYRSGAWTAITPIKGQIAHVQDESDAVIVWAGSSYVTVTTSTPLGKYDATTAPTVNEDSGDGYSVGSLWIDVTADAAYVCLDASAGAAVWLQVQDAADIDPVATTKSNLAASAAPAVTDDDGSGYGVGSVWIDTTNDAAYLCLDASTGAAVWLNIQGSGDLDAFAAVKTNLAATAAPTTGDDSGDGYGVGSLWLDTTNDKAYICLDATATAAVWTEITQSGGGGGSGYTPQFKTAAYTASTGDKVFVDCSGGAVTITLPATPSTGNEVIVSDSSGDAATNNVTVARNGSTIDGAAADFVIDLNYGGCGFAYNGTTWVIDPKNGVS